MGLRRSLTALAFLVGAVSCSDALSHRDVAGVYARRVGALTPVPYGDGTLRVIADTIVLRIDGSGSYSNVLEFTIAGSPTPTIERNDFGLSYQLKGWSVGLTTYCLGVCAAVGSSPQWYQWLAGTLRRPGAHRVVYERIGDAAAP